MNTNKKIFILVVISFLLGVFLSSILKLDLNNILNFNNYKNEKIEKLDFSFLYEVENKLNDKFIDTREDQSKSITSKDKIFGAAEGLVSARGDMHTSFFPPEDSELFLDDISGEFSGVGMEISNLNGVLMVIAPLPDSPAFKSGIRPKDIISKIEDKDALTMSSSVAVKLIRGKKDTYVNLEVLRKGESDPVKIKIKRDVIKIPIVKTFVKDGVFVIKLFSFTENSSELFFKKILTDFKKSKTDKMIIDLRGNSGGLLSAGVFISGLFLKENDVIVSEDYGKKEGGRVWKSGDIHKNPSKTTNIFRGLKLGILVDNGTASASEILAGALLDHKKAILFGENTFGKGTVQEMVEFDNGSSLKVTIAKFILPNGEWISYKGISPDVEIEMEKDEWKIVREKGSYSDYIDSQLKETITYMKSIKNQKDFEQKINDFLKKRILEKTKKQKEEKAKKILRDNE